MVRVFCAALLFKFTCGSDVLVPSSDGGKQCLMQKQHQISKSSNVADVYDQHPDRQTSLMQSTSEEREAGARKRYWAKRVDALVDRRSMRKAKIRHGKGSKTTEKGGHHKGNGNKHSHAGSAKKKHGKALAQWGASVRKELKSNSRKTGASQHGHRNKEHHWSKLPGSLAQTNASNIREVVARTHKPSLEELPKPILALAKKLFKTESAILSVLENTVKVNVTHAGVDMSLNMDKGDDATTRLASEGTWSSYDLDTLGDAHGDAKNMLNMIDVGGNYGVVTIAVMKKYPKNLRVVVVEPSPRTYFFLKWNLYTNGIPETDESALQDKAGVPGVLALNRGSADVAGQDLHFCSYPDSSMNAKVCDCKIGEDNCEVIPSVTVDDLAGMFGSEPIAMVKMDCEGCEFKCLPALAKPHLKQRVRRLAGELHIPDQSLETLACGWDNGRLVSKCQHSAKNYEDIECGVELACHA